MRKAGNREAVLTHILPEYGRKKLLMYADSFQDLADTFSDLGEREEDCEQTEDRQELLRKKIWTENRDLMAGHLKEMAVIMRQVAGESFHCVPVQEHKVKKLVHMLKAENILLKDIFAVKREGGYKEIHLKLKAGKGASPAAEDVGRLLSALMNQQLVPAAGCPVFIGKEWASYDYVEAPGFYVLTGVARAVKETETVSGDNYVMLYPEEGILLALLSDGMGSGEKACKDSELVIELVEKLLEAGFSRENALRMINGLLASDREYQNMSTLDLCWVNLYAGECEFMKIGAAPSYIKRGHLMEQISSRNLPLGVFREMELQVSRHSLEDGDYLILVSDGILDAMSQGIGEAMLPEILGQTELRNPSEMASHILNFCLHQSRGRIRDDMTVMVIGIWERAQ